MPDIATRKKHKGTKTAQPPLRLEWVEPETLGDNPRNWRIAGEGQLNAIDGLIEKVGWAGVLLFNETTGRLIDGHKRKQRSLGKGPVPVLIGQWSEENEKLLLATLHPSGELSTVDEQKLADLLRECTPTDDELGAIFSHLETQYDLGNLLGGNADDAVFESDMPRLDAGSQHCDAVPHIRFRKWQFSLSTDEAEDLERRIKAYVEANGSTLGIAQRMVDAI